MNRRSLEARHRVVGTEPAIGVVALMLTVGCGRIGYLELDPAHGGDLEGGLESSVVPDDVTSGDRKPPDAIGLDAVQVDAPATDVAADDLRDESHREAGCADDRCTPCVASTDCWCAEFGGRSYRFCATARTFEDANLQCVAAGMLLARVDDASENSWIRTAVDTVGITDFWIGVEDPTATLSWQWPDGTQFWSGTTTGRAVGGLYSNWSATSPSGRPNRQCASMLYYDIRGEWADRSCTSMLPFMCERY